MSRQLRHRVRPLFLTACALGAAFGWSLRAFEPFAQAQTASPEASSRAARPMTRSSLPDDLQISAQHYFYKEVAEDGPSRGELIYGYKCFMCHQKNSQD